MPRRITRKTKAKKDGKKVKLSVKVGKKKIIKKRHSVDLSSKRIRNEEQIEAIFERKRAEIKKAESDQNQLYQFKKVERKKRMIMWSGVSFFMVLIMAFWIYNTKQIFETEKNISDSQLPLTDWKEMTKEVGSQINEIRGAVNEMKATTSSDHEIQGLPSNDEVDSIETISSTTEVLGISNIEEEVINKLKKKLEEKIDLYL